MKMAQTGQIRMNKREGFQPSIHKKDEDRQQECVPQCILCPCDLMKLENLLNVGKNAFKTNRWQPNMGSVTTC